MAGNTLHLLSVTLFFWFAGAALAIQCSTGSGTYQYTFCSHSCCGSYPYEYCCYYDDYDDTGAVTAGVIVGGVIGGILFVSVVVAIVCCCIKSQGYEGRVVYPMPQQVTSTTVAYSGTSGQLYMQSAGPPPPPPQYPGTGVSNPV